MNFGLNKIGEKIISYKGIINSEKISELIEESESSISKIEKNRSLAKKVTSIIIEILQNLYHHTDTYVSNDIVSKEVEFKVKHDKDFYFVYSGNYIKTDKVDQLNNWLEKINSLSLQELKELYKSTLLDTNVKEKQGANLGLIDISKRSENKLEYEFQHINSNIKYFHLLSKIQKLP